ncbi:MAG: caspase family protein [Elusimicrobia bacterium]|nr:caspase family protein [Elusimicrobiota bacterium]
MRRPRAGFFACLVLAAISFPQAVLGEEPWWFEDYQSKRTLSQRNCEYRPKLFFFFDTSEEMMKLTDALLAPIARDYAKTQLCLIPVLESSEPLPPDFFKIHKFSYPVYRRGELGRYAGHPSPPSTYVSNRHESYAYTPVIRTIEDGRSIGRTIDENLNDGSPLSHIVQDDIWARMDADPDAKAGRQVLQRAKDLLASKDFAGFDKWFSELRRTQARFPNGGWQLHYLYEFLEHLGGDDKAAQGRIDLLKQWADQRPQSVTARAALGQAWSAFAFRGRGSKVAQYVTPEQWAAFNDRLSKAEAVLQEALALPEKCPEVFDGLVTVGFNRGWSRDKVDAIYENGARLFPYYSYLHATMTHFLRPKWGGWPGEAEAFASRVGQKYGWDQYTRILLRLTDADEQLDGEPIFGPEGFSWSKTKTGFREIIQKCPKSIVMLNNFARYALAAKDNETAKGLFDTIGDNYSVEIWGNRVRYEHFRLTMLEALNPRLASHRMPRPMMAEMNPQPFNPQTSQVSPAEAPQPDPRGPEAAPHPPLSSEAFSARMAQTIKDPRKVGRLIAHNVIASRRERGGKGPNIVVKPGTEESTGPEGDVVRLIGHSDAVTAVAYTADSKAILSASQDHTVRIWGRSADFQDKKLLLRVPNPLKALALSLEGRSFAVADDATNVYVQDLWVDLNGVGFLEIPGKSPAVALAFTPDGKRLAIGRADSRIEVVTPAQGAQEKVELSGHEGPVQALVFSRSGRYLASGGADGTLRTWDIDTKKLRSAFPGHASPITAIAYAPDYRTLASADARGGIRFWDAKTNAKRPQSFDLRSPIASLSYSPDGRSLAVTQSNEVHLLDLSAGADQGTVVGSGGTVAAVAFSPDGETVAAAGSDQLVRVFRTEGFGSRVAADGRVPAQRPTQDDVDQPPSPAMPMDRDAVAVVFGSQQYRQASIPKVDFASNDASAVQRYLTRAMGFLPENVVTLAGSGVNLASMRKTLGPWLRNRVNANSRVFIYFAGHGAPDPATGESYLVPSDGDPSYLNTALSVKELLSQLSALPAQRVMVVLDACFSGRGQRSIIAPGARPLVSVMDQSQYVGQNVVVLSATGGDQISTYYPPGRHGLFTYFLLRGLRGEADIDADGKVTTRELYLFLKTKVSKEARKLNVTQIPTTMPAPDQLGERARWEWIKLR